MWDLLLAAMALVATSVLLFAWEWRTSSRDYGLSDRAASDAFREQKLEDERRGRR